MTDMHELRDSEEARRFLLQGLWCQRAAPPQPGRVPSILQWALEIAAAGQPLPPLGFVADLGHIALGHDREAAAASVPVLPAGLLRSYEDHVLGKLYADGAFRRAADAVRRYLGREQSKALAFVFRQFAQRSGYRGVALSPSVIKSILDTAAETVLRQGWDSLGREGTQAVLVPQYEALLAAGRCSGEMLGAEDISQLERGVILKPEGEQLAERQVLRAAAILEAQCRAARQAAPTGPREVPTNILDEDTYPVGGFASLSTRGSIESLLHSQLAYMEEKESPDLFDVKFVRDELLYYARDENQFLRRRRCFVFALYPDLVQTRFKDRGLEFQRGVLLLALLYVLVRKWIDDLSADSLSFRFLFVRQGESDPLATERDLLASLLCDEIADGLVHLQTIPEERMAPLCAEWARKSLCHALLIDARPRTMRINEVAITCLQMDGPRPALGDGEQAPSVPEGEDAMASWSAALGEILQRGTHWTAPQKVVQVL